MNLFFHHFDIYKSIYKKEDQFILSPYLCDSIDDNLFINNIKNKVRLGYGNDFCYTNDLILYDKSLLEDLKDKNCFVIFFLCNEAYQDKHSYYYNDEWDNNLKKEDLIFLGWNIYSYTDSAMTDGIYPIMIKSPFFLGEDISKNLILDDKDDINNWGLLPDILTLEKYLKLNKEEVIQYINNKEVKMDWEPIGVFCDKYTFNKLNSLLK